MEGFDVFFSYTFLIGMLSALFLGFAAGYYRAKENTKVETEEKRAKYAQLSSDT